MSQKPERIFLSPPHMGGAERKYVEEAFDSNFIAPVGPMLEAFEAEFATYTGLPHCVALSSGTAALHLALRSVGVGAGGEVYASNLTFIGSITPILYQQATPVFIDADMDTWNMDPNLLEDALAKASKKGKLPKAVLPTDLYGQCCDMDALRNICDRYGVPLIIDAAESVGARYQGAHAGHGARAAAFSFNGNKIITPKTPKPHELQSLKVITSYDCYYVVRSYFNTRRPTSSGYALTAAPRPLTGSAS